MEYGNDTLAVKDLNVASFLMATGLVKLAGTERNHNKTAYFHFSPREKADALISQYWSDNAPAVQPRILFNAMRNLKDVIFGGNPL